MSRRRGGLPWRIDFSHITLSVGRFETIVTTYVALLQHDQKVALEYTRYSLSSLRGHASQSLVRDNMFWTFFVE